MKNGLLKKMLDAGVFRRPFQAGHGKVFVDYFGICGDTSLMTEAGEALGMEISDATVDQRGMPTPDLLIATGRKSIILAQWVLNSIRTSGLGNVAFKWCEYNKGAKHTFLEPHYGFIHATGKKSLVVTMELGSGDKAREAVSVAKREMVEIIGVVALFNRWGLTASQIDAPCLISLFSEEDVLRTAKDLIEEPNVVEAAKQG